MNKIDFATECFNKGFSCSQAVLAAFAEDYGLDKKLALKIRQRNNRQTGN